MPNEFQPPNKHAHSRGKVEKAGFNQSWGKLIAYCKPYMTMIVLAITLAFIGTICTIIGPDYLSEMTDLIMEGLGTGIDLEAIKEVGLFLVAIYVLSSVFSYLQGFIMATVTQKVSKKLRTATSEKINKLPLKYFDSNSYGDVLSRITNDIDTLGQTMNQSIGTLVTAVTLFLGTLFMMLKTNVPMALTAVASTMIGFGLMGLIVKSSQKHFINQQRELGAINGYVEEIYAGHSIVKVYNGEEEAKETFEKINTRLYNSAWRAQFLSGMMMPIMTFIGNFGYVAVCVVGASLAMNDKISFGVIVAFMVYIRLFTQPLAQMAQAVTSLQSTAAASKRVFDFLDEAELEDESHKKAVLKDVKGNVEFKNVRFGYNADKTVIHNFSVSVKAGEKVAIVGPTGAGKSTMVNLLMRFYEVNGGEITIDGVPIHTLKRENVHEQFCMVLQDTWLFEGTIRENIVYNKKDVSDEEVFAACKAVGISHFIESLPKGYDTILNDQISLSAGQKQLLTIARAMVENAPLLILDEATSSVDTRTEVLIQEAMDKLTVGRTSFVIAHRLSTIKNADMILVMKDGDIIESGTHAALLEKEGFYADLYNSQFSEDAFIEDEYTG